MPSDTFGRYCWFELATTDKASALSFYTQLFGLRAREVPMPEGGTYALLMKGDERVGGMFQLTSHNGLGKVPPSWASYVWVENADLSVKRTTQLGGSIVEGPFDVGAMGRMAVLRDPEGAVFHIWQPKEEGHAARMDDREEGHVCWVELQTRDPQRAAVFYSALFGWTADTRQDDGYVQIFAEGVAMGGMFDMSRRSELADIPPHWLPYFAVANLDTSANKLKQLGGRLHMGPMDLPSIGRFAVVADPQGASFYLFELDAAHGKPAS